MKKHLFLGLAASALLAMSFATVTSNANAKSTKPSNVKTSKVAKSNTNQKPVKHRKARPHYHVYQNPKRYYQVQYNQIKGAKKIPSIGKGWEGMRTYKFTHKYGLPDGHNYFTYGDAYFVRNFQRRHHLPVTGRINYKTWRRMGFSKYKWNTLDNYIPKEHFSPRQGRWAHINAGIRHIKKYLGGIWISGTSSSPEYKKADCSGLAMQYLLAGGLYDTHSGNPMLHARPGNEWDSRKMFADPRLKRVSFKNRQRGDLIFFAPSYGSAIWHVGIMTSRNTMIDSWPPVIEYHSIFNGEHGVIAGIKRPFI